MIGQGSPYHLRRAIGQVRRQFACAMLTVASLAMIFCAAAKGQEPPTMNLRFAFGGGEARVWRGVVTLSEGSFGALRGLGLEPDEPGSLTLTERSIEVRQPSPRQYDGFDVAVSAPLDAKIRVLLSSTSTPPVARQFDMKLRDLINSSQPAGDGAPGALDDKGNRLVVARAPGDQLRVLFDRDSLVFSPGERFQFSIAPKLLGIEPKTVVRLKVRIASRVRPLDHFVRQIDVEANADGEITNWGPHEFELPPGDDVYDLTVSATRKSIFDPLVAANPLSSTKPLFERQLQFVSIDKQPAPAAAITEPETVDQFDPVNPKWAERVARLPLLKHLPRMTHGSLSSGRTSVRAHQGKNWMQIDAEGWLAYPLSIAQPGVPHVLEVEYPDDLPQSLGISILEPNSVGAMVDLGLDSGVRVESPPAGRAPSVARHRIVFWPRSKTPVILLLSHDSKRPAVIGRIRLQRLAGSLPPLTAMSEARDRRMIAAWFEKPLFPEVFLASQSRDPVLTRSLDDWTTFYEGGSRLAQQLKFAGYNTVVLPVLCEGSTLYPSRLLQPTPKYDTGIFISAGNDPLRKDVLEMLLRMFDREGLTLVPSLQFSTPLPELEELLRSQPNLRAGIEPVDHTGKAWVDSQSPRGGLAPYYNPLDERVQQAMDNVVRELATRYGHHPSLRGVAVQLSPMGYTMLPGAGWGFDDRTFATFTKEVGIADPGSGATRFEQRARWCASEGRSAWLHWRADRMANLYGRLAASLRHANSDAKLYIAGSDMFESESMQRVLRPTLPRRSSADELVADALLEIGFDGDAIRRYPGLVALPVQPVIPWPTSQPSLGWDALGIDYLASRLGGEGTLFYSEPHRRRLESFDQLSPFGKENTFTWLAAQLSPSGSAQRKRFVESLVQRDQLVWMDGGWTMTLGQEEQLSPLLAVAAQLPAKRFTSITNGDPASQPVVIRTLTDQGKTFVYFVNNSPWPAKVKLEVKANGELNATALAPQRAVPALEGSQGSYTWTIDLEPYDLTGGIFNRPNVVVAQREVTLPATVADALRLQLNDLRSRAAALKSPRKLDGLVNASFEEPLVETTRIPGWLVSQGDGIEAKIGEKGHGQGSRSLMLTSRGPVAWVRSEPIPAPTTGRITVWVWLNIPDESRQPPLRLAIEARRGSEEYYRFARVGAGGVPLASGWSPFVLQIDDLPRHGLEEFRIGFDLMGPGEVYIDDVEVFDLSFTEKEQTELKRTIIATADSLLRENHTAAAAQVLDSYWPRFLTESVVPVEPRVADVPASPLPSTPPPAEKSMFDRFKGWVPRPWY